MPDDGDKAPAYWYIEDVATGLGFSVSAIKKWRGAYLRARKAGRPPGANALPAPDNEREVIEQGARPRWRPEVLTRWAVQTRRRDPVTGEPRNPPPPGPPPRSQRRK